MAVILALFLGLMMLFFLAGMPVALSLGVASLGVAAIERGVVDLPYTIIAQRMFYGVNSFPLLAIPFFLLAGHIMNAGGISERIFAFAHALVGHWRGGLGHVNIVASMIFSGMSGSAVADAMGLGTVEIRAMRKAGYGDDFSAAVTAASATIGPIIPPSIPLILYAVLANTSVTAVLLAGIVPGVLMGVAMMILVAIQARRRNFPREARASLAAAGIACHRALLPMLAPALIIGGIWTGFFTPTEAAAVAAVYALLLASLVYREIGLRQLWAILTRTMYETAAIMLIIAAANLYAWLLVYTKVPLQLTEMITEVSQNPLIILLVVNLLLLVVGCFLETLAAITVLTPLLMPTLLAVGIDPVHFGIVMVLNLMIGLLTPPFGMVSFAVAKIADLPADRVMRAVAPFYLPLSATLLLISVFPQMTLFLPGLMR